MCSRNNGRSLVIRADPQGGSFAVIDTQYVLRVFVGKENPKAW